MCGSLTLFHRDHGENGGGGAHGGRRIRDCLRSKYGVAKRRSRGGESRRVRRVVGAMTDDEGEPWRSTREPASTPGEVWTQACQRLSRGSSATPPSARGWASAFAPGRRRRRGAAGHADRLRARLDPPQRLAPHRASCGPQTIRSTARSTLKIERGVRGGRRRPRAPQAAAEPRAVAVAAVLAGRRRRPARRGAPGAAPPACRSASPSTPSSPGPANEFAYAVARRVGVLGRRPLQSGAVPRPLRLRQDPPAERHRLGGPRAAPDKTVIYLTAERFLSTFVRAVMDRPTAAFKDELRAADLLLIDDVHFVAGKASTQEELFHTLTALMEDGRRVVLSADRPPARAGRDGRRACARTCRRAWSAASSRPTATCAWASWSGSWTPWPPAGRQADARGPRCCSSWPTASPTACASWKAR